MSGNRAERRAGVQRPAGPPPGRYGSGLQRRALAPAVLAAGVLVGGLLLVGQDGYLYIRFAVCALALMTAVFAWQSIRRWAAVVPVVVAVLWNPVAPFGFAGTPFRLGHVVAAVLLLVVGLSAPYREDPAAR